LLEIIVVLALINVAVALLAWTTLAVIGASILAHKFIRIYYVGKLKTRSALKAE